MPGAEQFDHISSMIQLYTDTNFKTILKCLILNSRLLRGEQRLFQIDNFPKIT